MDIRLFDADELVTEDGRSRREDDRLVHAGAEARQRQPPALVGDKQFLVVVPHFDLGSRIVE